MSDPCPRCGVRADVDCAHRPGSGSPPASLGPQREPVDGRKAKAISGGGRYRAFPSGKGLNFKHKADK